MLLIFPVLDIIMNKWMIEIQTKKWLKYLCENFSVGDTHILDTDKCFIEMDEFMCTIYKSYP